MTIRYVHPAEEQKRFAAGKLEKFRLAGIVEVMEKAGQSLQFPLHCSKSDERERPQLIARIGRGAEIRTRDLLRPRQVFRSKQPSCFQCYH